MLSLTHHSRSKVLHLTQNKSLNWTFLTEILRVSKLSARWATRLLKPEHQLKSNDIFGTHLVVYWPSTRPNMPFQSDAPERSDTFQWQLWEEIARRAWLKKLDKVKIAWNTRRLMHRKRVTCELHDSYFRLMTIKHAIPKIEWVIELLYNSVKTGSQWVGEQTTWR